MGAILHRQQRRRQFGLVAQQPGGLPLDDLRWIQEQGFRSLARVPRWEPQSPVQA